MITICVWLTIYHTWSWCFIHTHSDCVASKFLWNLRNSINNGFAWTNISIKGYTCLRFVIIDCLIIITQFDSDDAIWVLVHLEYVTLDKFYSIVSLTWTRCHLRVLKSKLRISRANRATASSPHDSSMIKRATEHICLAFIYSRMSTERFLSVRCVSSIKKPFFVPEIEISWSPKWGLRKLENFLH